MSMRELTLIQLLPLTLGALAVIGGFLYVQICQVSKRRATEYLARESVFSAATIEAFAEENL